MMNVKNNKIKKIICRNWINGNCIFSKKDCRFAHGENDIIRSNCLNGIYCYNENCVFVHPKEWDPYDNKKECLFCCEGFCDKKNKKFKHVNIDDKNKNQKNQDINSSDILLEITKKDININEKINKDNIIYNEDKKYSDYEDYDKIISLKKELYMEYLYISKLDHNDWSNDIYIEESQNNIKEIRDKYIVLKEKNKKEDVFNDELNLQILENENINYNNCGDNQENTKVNINITLNDIPIEDFTKSELLKKYDKILNIIEEMEDINKNHIINIKCLLDQNNIIKNDKDKLFLKFNLNKIMKELYLFKLNYIDFKQNINY